MATGTGRWIRVWAACSWLGAMLPTPKLRQGSLDPLRGSSPFFPRAPQDIGEGAGLLAQCRVPGPSWTERPKLTRRILWGRSQPAVHVYRLAYPASTSVRLPAGSWQTPGRLVKLQCRCLSPVVRCQPCFAPMDPQPLDLDRLPAGR